MSEDPTCPYCGEKARLVDDTEVYGRSFGGRVWVCGNFPECYACVGHNEYTGLPNGTLANSHLRKLRKRAHEAFDTLWKDGGMTRTQAYEELARVLMLPMEEAHIGKCDEQQCVLIVEVFSNRDQPEFFEDDEEDEEEEEGDVDLPPLSFHCSEFGKEVANATIASIMMSDDAELADSISAVQQQLAKYIDDSATRVIHGLIKPMGKIVSTKQAKAEKKKQRTDKAIAIEARRRKREEGPF